MRCRRPSIMRTAEFRMLAMSMILASSAVMHSDSVKFRHNYNLPKDPIIALMDTFEGKALNPGKKFMHNIFTKASKFVK